jgi:predicted DNA-binding transcriptional regulator YafY
MPSATYAVFRKAILAEKQIVCSYEGRPRELCPHIIGLNRNGEEVVLAWQFGGDSSGPLPQWRCLRLAEVRDARMRDGRWHAGGSQDDAEMRQHGRSRYQRSCAEVAVGVRRAARVSFVAWIERSEIRGGVIRGRRFPDFARLNPGYEASSNISAFPNLTCLKTQITGL